MATAGSKRTDEPSHKLQPCRRTPELVVKEAQQEARRRVELEVASRKVAPPHGVECEVDPPQDAARFQLLAALRAARKAAVARLVVLHTERLAKRAEGADIARATGESQFFTFKRPRWRSAAEREREVKDAWFASGDD